MDQVAGGSTGSGLLSSGSILVKRQESSSNLPLPMNLLSAKNEQKAAAVMSANVPIRQQLPMKLAKLGNSLGASSTNISSPSNNSIVQQLLPLRLSENLEQKRSPKAGEYSRMPNEGSKPKLSSNSFSPPASKSEDFSAGHNRTGSSPASIQMLNPYQRLQNQQPPKVPEKPVSLLTQTKSSPLPKSTQQQQQQPQQQQPRMHDPETNQEIVYL